MRWAISSAATIPSARSPKTITSARTVRTPRCAPGSTVCATSRRSASSPVPGRTTAVMQNALIAHCELMRYRFAVLDGPRAAAGHARRRADAAPAVRHEVRGALSPVAADSRSVSGESEPDRRLSDPAVGPHASASTRAPTSSAACTRRRPTKSCAASSACSGS